MEIANNPSHYASYLLRRAHSPYVNIHSLLFGLKHPLRAHMAWPNHKKRHLEKEM